MVPSLCRFMSLQIAAEHILNIISIVHFTNQCPSHHKDPIKHFFLEQLSQMFQFTAYAPWKAFLGKCLNVICTFVWTFMDVFVMVISVGLSNRFAQLNDDLKRVKGKVCCRNEKPRKTHIANFRFDSSAPSSIWHKTIGRSDANCIEVYANFVILSIRLFHRLRSSRLQTIYFSFVCNC